MKKRKIINDIILWLGVACYLFYLGCGLFVRFGQSMLWLWPLAGTVCLARYLLVRRSIQTGKPVPLPRWFIVAGRVFLIVGFSFFFFVVSFVVRGSFTKAPAGLDAIVVLGAKVNGTAPSGALDQRIGAAARYLLVNPDTICVASGGQGEDEGISEAACIRENLLRLGIEDERIIMEDQSTDTQTNLANSFALLPEGTKTVGVVTSDFHVCRALLLAETRGGYEFYGVPARSTAAGYLHYTVREFCALVVTYLEGDIDL